MSALLWTKWYFPDWTNDPGLRASSLAARGLWMDMLCLAARHDPPGYVAINGNPASPGTLARMVGASVQDVESLLDELERNGVFSRNRTGMIYSRRMVRENKAAKISRENGKKGGNPNLCKDRGISERDNHTLNPPLNTHKPEARSQKEKEIDFQSISKKKSADPPDDGEPRPEPAAFPPDGSIAYTDFAKLCRTVRPGVDPDVFAAAFRGFCRATSPPIAFDDPKISRRFVGFVRNHNISGMN